MAKVVFVATREAGHLLPTVAIAQACAARGMSVRFAAASDRRRIVEAAGLEFVALPRHDEHDAAMHMGAKNRARAAAPMPSWLPPAAETFVRTRVREWDFRNVMPPMIEGMARAVRELLESERADALVYDCFAFGARYGAELAGVRFASVGHDPSFQLNAWNTLAMPPAPWLLRVPPAAFHAAVDAALPFARVRRRLGLPPQRRTAEFYSLMSADALHIVTAPRWMIAVPPRPESVHVGPLSFDWEPPDAPPAPSLAPGTVLVAGSTVPRPIVKKRYREVARAVARAREPSVILAAQASDVPGDLGDHVRVLDGFVSHAALIPQAGAFVTHGGWGAVGKALRHAIPMLVIPAFGAQFLVGKRIAELGLGRFLDPDEVNEDSVRRELDALRSDRRVAARLAEVRDELGRMPSSELASEAVERLLG